MNSRELYYCGTVVMPKCRIFTVHNVAGFLYDHYDYVDNPISRWDRDREVADRIVHNRQEPHDLANNSVALAKMFAFHNHWYPHQRRTWPLSDAEKMGILGPGDEFFATISMEDFYAANRDYSEVDQKALFGIALDGNIWKQLLFPLLQKSFVTEDRALVRRR